jgi:Uncharacterized protein conserved in bacteria
MQYTFDSGERVDAIVRADRTIPVDSKFPLDNYIRLSTPRRMTSGSSPSGSSAGTSSSTSTRSRPSTSVPTKAPMTSPSCTSRSKGSYYELACGKTGALLTYAHERRVFPVSPTTFTAYLQVIALGLRGMQIEEHAHEVMAYVADLRRDFDRFADDFDKVGTHLGHAQSKYHEAGSASTSSGRSSSVPWKSRERSRARPCSSFPAFRPMLPN